LIIGVVLSIIAGCTAVNMDNGDESDVTGQDAAQNSDDQVTAQNSDSNVVSEEELSEDGEQQILADNVKAQSSSGQGNSQPTIKITEPDNGQTQTEEQIKEGFLKVWWEAKDSNDDKLLIKLEYKGNGGWKLIADEVSNDGSFLWDVSALSDGEYSLRATVTDGALSSSSSKTFTIDLNK